MKQRFYNLARVSNPAFKKFTDRFGTYTEADSMTVQGAINKVALLIATTVGAAILTGWLFYVQLYALTGILAFLGILGGLTLAIITVYRPHLASTTGVLYALCQGIVVGLVSAATQLHLPGIVPIAICLTGCTVIAILFAYLTGVLKATEGFKLMLFAATISVCMTYTFSLIFSLFGIKFPLIHDTNIYGIIFSLIVVAIAALNLVLDFDLIEQGAEHRLPKYMEWYAAFSVLVTLIWLYLEILRLVSKLQRRK